MRKNPLLYSEHHEPQEIIQPSPPLPEEPRSFFFYVIILANSLLVLFVLGVIWFLFLKSPDLELKSLTNRFFGNTEEPTMVIESPANTPAPAEAGKAPSKQEQDEIQQARLKQMREQQELTAERSRLEQLRQALETEKQRTDALTSALPATASSDEATETSTIIITPETAIESTAASEATTVVPDAAREVPPVPVHSDDTKSQVDEIMEMLKQQALEKQQ